MPYIVVVADFRKKLTKDINKSSKFLSDLRCFIGVTDAEKVREKCTLKDKMRAYFC